MGRLHFCCTSFLLGTGAVLTALVVGEGSSERVSPALCILSAARLEDYAIMDELNQEAP